MDTDSTKIEKAIKDLKAEAKMRRQTYKKTLVGEKDLELPSKDEPRVDFLAQIRNDLKHVKKQEAFQEEP